MLYFFTKLEVIQREDRNIIISQVDCCNANGVLSAQRKDFVGVVKSEVI